MRKIVFALVTLICLMLCGVCLAQETMPVLTSAGDTQAKASGENDYVIYPVLENGGEYADSVNTQMMEKARINAFLQLMQFGTGSTGLRVDWDGHVKGNVLSVVIGADGKMPVGRPSQVYYPMNFDLETGEEISFEALFTDADAAMAHMEMLLENEVEETLSTHLENSELFPVPFERYTLERDGGLTIWYEKDQLSFLSGFSGSVHFRFSDLEEYYDLTEGSVMQRFRQEGETGYLRGFSKADCLGLSFEETVKHLRSTVDSEFYPGGALFEMEDAPLRGNYLITDESEEKVLGILCGRVDDGKIMTGKTTMDEAKELLGDNGISILVDADIAAQYRVCPGESVTYKTTVTVEDEQRQADYTLYGDEGGIVRFVKLMITD
ncbi:MAG: hypothetical protein IKJ51_09575 [Clostridia bacterium]|nr:hypothetical protein [Clostridia bacterium]